MHRRLVVLLIASLACLAVPVGAHAKGLTGLSICGTNGCVSHSGEIRGDSELMQAFMSYGAAVADPGPGQYVKLKLSLGDGGQTFGHQTATYYPALGIQGDQDGTFYLVDPAAKRMLTTWAREVHAFGKPAAVAPVAAKKTSAVAAPSGDGGDGGVSWAVWVGGAVALAALAAVAAAVVLRRGGRPATG